MPTVAQIGYIEAQQVKIEIVRTDIVLRLDQFGAVSAQSEGKTDVL